MNNPQLAKASSAAELLKLIESIFAGDSMYFWENEVHLTDPAKGTPSVADLERSRTGRIFNPRCDLEWRRNKQEFHATILGETKAPGLYSLPGSWETRAASYLLIGTQVENGWRDTRFPRTINYPAGTTAAPTAEIDEYIDADSGLLQYVRIKRIVEAQR